uniref:Cyclic nucleotide-binding domain-containing protein n=1 Tax=Zooxanthella nutricula TaxID=1333877 RepID=A0A7S2QCX8_9DINO
MLDSNFHRLHRELLAEHDTQVQALADEIAKLKGKALYSPRTSLPSVHEDVLSPRCSPTFQEPVEHMSRTSSKRSSSKRSTGSNGHRDIELPNGAIKVENGHVGEMPSSRSMARKQSKRKPTENSMFAASAAETIKDQDFELWPEWTMETISSPSSRRHRHDHTITAHLYRRMKNRYKRDTRNLETDSCQSDDAGISAFAPKSIFWYLRRRQFRQCLPKLPISPGSRTRMSWDFTGLALLVYDVYWIPLQVCFQPRNFLFGDVMGWISLLFWTLDIPSSFISGYHRKDGSTELSFSRIAKRYLMSWFVLDVVIVGADWMAVLLDLITRNSDPATEGVGLARLGKMMRVARILRSLRLLRLAKIRQLLYVVEERIQSEYISILGGLVQQIAGLLALNHLFACFWWVIGISVDAPNWVAVKGLADKEVILQYLVSLHWSFSQFTPASMEVYPENIGERAYNVVVLVFAMVVFSSFVSSITSAMTRLRTLRAHEVAQAYLLKRYLRENNISADLSSRVTRYIDVVSEVHKRRTDRSKVELLQMLSGPLNLELQREVYIPYISVHPYLNEYNVTSPSAMGHLCFTAVSKMSLSRGDILFNVGEDSNTMFFLVSGTLFYRRVKGIKSAKRLTMVPEGTVFCEAALWVPWVHRGRMKAVIESDVVGIDSEKFREVTLAHPEVTWHACRYSRMFLDEMREEALKHSMVWDLPRPLMEIHHNSSATVMFADGEYSSSPSTEVHSAEKLECFLMNDSSGSSEDEEAQRSGDQPDPLGPEGGQEAQMPEEHAEPSSARG